MDSDWRHAVFLGQRALSGEYMVGTPDGICRPRSIHRRPEEKRWEDVLSNVIGLPWKLRKHHDGDKEVFLDENPAEPSSSPTVSPLPLIVTEEPIERIRNFYVTSKDVDHNSGGLVFTDGCKGCRAIINNKNPVAHSPECRLKVMEQAPNNEKIAARVKRTVGRDQSFHARNLEKNEERKKRENEVHPPPEPVGVNGGGSEGAPRAQVGGSASSASPSPAMPAQPSRKRGAGDQLDQDRESPGVQTGGTSGGSAGPEVQQGTSQDQPASQTGVKRSAEDDPVSAHPWRTGDEIGPQSQEDANKERRLNLVEDLVDALEGDSVQVCTGNGEVQMPHL